jgi:hypothetical protein
VWENYFEIAYCQQGVMSFPSVPIVSTHNGYSQNLLTVLTSFYPNSLK